jgi:hypothetical protein
MFLSHIVALGLRASTLTLLNIDDKYDYRCIIIDTCRSPRSDEISSSLVDVKILSVGESFKTPRPFAVSDIDRLPIQWRRKTTQLEFSYISQTHCYYTQPIARKTVFKPLQTIPCALKFLASNSLDTELLRVVLELGAS